MRSSSARRLFLVLVAAAAVLGAIAAASVFGDVRIPTLTRDVSAIAGIHPFAGLLSTVGILVWCATAATCLFSAFALRSTVPAIVFRFFLSSALLTGFLLFDDLFLLHETLAPLYLRVPEWMIYAVFALALLAYGVAFHGIIARTGYALLLVAVALLGSSVVIDLLVAEPSPLGPWLYLLEDGAKWLGIASWCGYFVHTCLAAFAERLAPPGAAPGGAPRA